MKYSVTLSAPLSEELYRCFRLEANKQQRSSLTIEKKKTHVELRAEAEDAIALKATLHSMALLLEVFEKTQKIEV